MVSKYYIERNIRSLSQKYNQSKTQAEPIYYAKLAVIELCGWIEVSIDEIVEKAAVGFQANSHHRKQFVASIEGVYGFHEKKHLRPLIRQLIGARGLDSLEHGCDTPTLSKLYRHLNELSEIRNRLAHTYITGFTPTLESPSITLRRLTEVHAGLEHLESKLADFTRRIPAK